MAQYRDAEILEKSLHLKPLPEILSRTLTADYGEFMAEICGHTALLSRNWCD
jgi:hypothetical protein